MISSNPSNTLDPVGGRLRTLVCVAVVALVVVATTAGSARAADKELACHLVSIDHKAKTMTVMTAGGEQVFHVNAKTEYFGPNGAVATSRLKDGHLVKGVPLKLHLAPDQKHIQSVHIK